MIAQTTRYGISTTVPLDYDRAVARTKEPLAGEWFGLRASRVCSRRSSARPPERI